LRFFKHNKAKPCSKAWLLTSNIVFSKIMYQLKLIFINAASVQIPIILLNKCTKGTAPRGRFSCHINIDLSKIWMLPREIPNKSAIFRIDRLVFYLICKTISAHVSLFFINSWRWMFFCHSQHLVFASFYRLPLLFFG